MVSEMQKRALVQGTSNRQVFKPAVDPFKPTTAISQLQNQKFAPLISVDRSKADWDNFVFQPNNGQRNFASRGERILEFHYSFKPELNDPNATNQLRVQLNAPIQAVSSFAKKTKRFILE